MMYVARARSEEKNNRHVEESLHSGTTIIITLGVAKKGMYSRR